MLRQASDLVAQAMRGVVVASMVVLVFCVFLQVFSRYVLKNSVPWTEEMARYALVYLTFAGAAIATRKAANIRVDFVVNALPKPLQFLFACLSDLLVAGVSLMLVYYGGRFAWLSKDTVSPAIDQSMLWVNATLPIAASLILVWSLASLAGRIAARGREE